MKAAAPRARRQARLLIADDIPREVALTNWPELLAPGDVVVFNDAATLPAALPLRAGARSLELRLTEAPRGQHLHGVVLGSPGWREDTDARPALPELTDVYIGDVSVEVLSQRRSQVLLLVENPWELVYRLGRPIQYSYHKRNISLAEIQGPWADRPWAVEMPSAGRSLTQDILQRLKGQGVEVHSVTHAAGISATGDPELDAHLPLPERYEIPEMTAKAVRAAAHRGARVIAVGTSVLRALESSALRGAEQGRTSLHVGPETNLRWVTGLLTGFHQPGTSHDRLLQAFRPARALRSLLRWAAPRGFEEHEFGDLVFIPDRRPFPRPPAVVRSPGERSRPQRSRRLA